MSIFTGSAVALITPFNPNGSVNFEKLKELIDFHLAHKTDALVVCGTTGEASTLTDEDQVECIRVAAEHVNKRVPVKPCKGLRKCRCGRTSSCNTLL